MADLATLMCADVLAWAREYDGPPFHAMLTDPPYELNFMSSRWDNTGISFRPATWVALAQHLLPGAFCMVFASSRGYHRLACALEDAGLIAHPSVFMLGWVQGSGFPKSTRVDSQIDAAAGVEQEVVGEGPYTSRRPHADHNGQGLVYADDSYVRPAGDVRTAPATPLAQTWAGHRYGGQVLKPALEPVLCFQVPYQGRPVDSIVRTGAGSLWIEGGRLPLHGEQPTGSGQRESWREMENRTDRQPWNGGNVTPTSGRWPPNLALVHHNLCQPEACSDQCPVAALEAQAGESVSTASGHRVSRFFHVSDWSLDVAEQLAQAAPAYYCPKSPQEERSAGLESRSNHPTVKPLTLLRWLATLLLPPAAYAPRRILVPFAGSGSECIGTILAGWEHVTGIEQDPAYVALARRRLAYWTGWRAPTQDPAPATTPAPPVRAGTAQQLTLF